MNTTPNINLPQFVGSDNFSYGILNKAFWDIDQAIQGVNETITANNFDYIASVIKDIETLKKASTNVAFFGAKLDGVTDDYSAVIKAINSTPQGGSVYIPNGVLVTGQTIVVPHGITLIGNFNSSVIKAKDGANLEAVIKIAPTQDNHKATLYSLSIECNKANSGATDGVLVSSVSYYKTNTSIIFCNITNAKGNGFNSNANVENIVLESVVIENCDVNGVNTNSPLTFVKNTTVRFCDRGVVINKSAKDSFLLNNTVQYNAKDGVLVLADNCNIRNNLIFANAYSLDGKLKYSGLKVGDDVTTLSSPIIIGNIIKGVSKYSDGMGCHKTNIELLKHTGANVFQNDISYLGNNIPNMKEEFEVLTVEDLTAWRNGTHTRQENIAFIDKYGIGQYFCIGGHSIGLMLRNDQYLNNKTHMVYDGAKSLEECVGFSVKYGASNDRTANLTPQNAYNLWNSNITTAYYSFVFYKDQNGIYGTVIFIDLDEKVSYVGWDFLDSFRFMYPVNETETRNNVLYLKNWNSIASAVPLTGATITGLLETDKNDINSSSNFSGNYNDLTNKPTIPTVDVTKAYVDTALTGKANSTHTHQATDIIGGTGGGTTEKFKMLLIGKNAEYIQKSDGAIDNTYKAIDFACDNAFSTPNVTTGTTTPLMFQVPKTGYYNVKMSVPFYFNKNTSYTFVGGSAIRLGICDKVPTLISDIKFLGTYCPWNVKVTDYAEYVKYEKIMYLTANLNYRVYYYYYFTPHFRIDGGETNYCNYNAFQLSVTEV